MTNPAKGSYDRRNNEDSASAAWLAARVERLERALRSSEAIHGLQVDLVEASSLETVGDLTLDFLEMMLGIDWGRVSLVEGGYLEPRVSYSADEQGAVGSRLASRAVRTGRIQMYPESGPGSSGSRIYPFVQLAVPIRMDAGVGGVILVGRARVKPFTDEEAGIVETVSEHVADALERLIRSRIGSHRRLSLEDYL